MGDKKATRRSCSYGRAKNQSVHQDAHIVAQTERAWKLLPVAFGICFALMCAIQIAMGW